MPTIDPLTAELLGLIGRWQEREGRTDAQLARLAGITQQRIADLRGGRRTADALSLLLPLIRAIGVSAADCGRLLYRHAGAVVARRKRHPEKSSTAAGNTRG